MYKSAKLLLDRDFNNNFVEGLNMKRKMTITLLLFCGLLILGILQFVNSASASTIRIVNLGGSIQEAINNAQPGDIILIKKGIYNEYPIFVNKSVTLLGESKEETIIDGGGTATVIINVLADNAKIRNLTVQNTGTYMFPVFSGISTARVRMVEISDCIIRNCEKCIRLDHSNNTKIQRNNITLSNGYGIHLDESSTDNLIMNNYVANNSIGIQVETTAINNKIYHNNFIGNVLDRSGGSGNSWHNSYPSGGNYWSKHASQDIKSGVYQNETGSDGIADSEYYFDKYPLMGPVHTFWAGNWGGDYYVSISSNSTKISNFQFDNTTCHLQFDAIGTAPQYGFSRIMISNTLLWIGEGEQWIVKINGTSTSPNVREDPWYTYVYINYSHCITTIEIIGTHAIPEISMPVLITIVLTAIGIQIVLKKKLRFQKI